MKNRIHSLTSFAAIAMALPGMCYAEGDTAEAGGEAQASATEAAPAVAGESAEAARKRAPAANFLPIVRGRMPMLLVHAVRFDEVLAKIGNKDLAAKMATSVGKIFDIRKNRNFAYLTKDWKPTAADVADAKAWAAQIGNDNAKGQKAAGDAALINGLASQYEAAGLASAEEAAKFAAAKPKSNFDKKPAGEAGAAATPSTLPGATAATEVQASAAGKADDLLV